MKKIGILMAFYAFFVFVPGSLAFTTEELLQLKRSGVSEEIIIFIVENDYQDVGKILRLKEAGFKDETILAVIKSELKKKPSAGKGGGEIIDNNKKMATKADQQIVKETAEIAGFETPARIKILKYMLYRGEVVLQSSQIVDVAKLSIVDQTLKFEWEDKGGLGLLDVFMRKPFKSPFYWDLIEDDSFGQGEAGYSFMLKSSTRHPGRPETDLSHYWVILLEPEDSRIAEYIKKWTL